MTQRLDFACLGETMMQFVPEQGTTETAPQFTAHVAGAESNVAIGLARLGASTAWLSRVGADAFGRRVRAHVAGQGVDVSLVTDDETHPTGVFFKQPTGELRKVTYYRSGSAASAMDRTDALRAIALAPRILHLTGITAALSTTCDEAMTAALASTHHSEPPTILSFDVNYRPALWPSIDLAARRLAELAAQADIVFVGLDEARHLWAVESAEDVYTLFDVPTLVVKDAPHRVTHFSAHTRVDLELPHVTVLESVGAGDAFAAGFLFGELMGWPALRQLRAGHVLAAIALGTFADQGDTINGQELAEMTDETAWAQ